MNLFNANPSTIQDVAFLQQWIRDLQETAYYRAELCIVLKEKSEILKSLIEKHEEYRSLVEGKNEELRHKVTELNSALLLNSERGLLRFN